MSFDQSIQTRLMDWKSDLPNKANLKKLGYKVFDFSDLKKRVLAVRETGHSRSSLGNPAEKILNIFRRNQRIAIIGVSCRTKEDLLVLYGYFLEPAFHNQSSLLIHADQSLDQIFGHCRWQEDHWRYPWTLERLKYLVEIGSELRCVPIRPQVNLWRQFWNKLTRQADTSIPPSIAVHLDPQQKAAVNAGDGVVQIIAPAGSGKTTVLIERVKELNRRGTPAKNILCMSFNRDAKVEIGQRLEKVGMAEVVVRSFHGMGLAILKEENQLRNKIGELGDSILELLIAEVEHNNLSYAGKSKTTADVRNTISSYKLSDMISPEDAFRRDQNFESEIYQRYEAELKQRNQLDFDDLVARSVHLLQSDSKVRSRWQKQFQRVLVDEYQDIEPVQALLVGILAAPEDSLFCVGDEDQCIYAWRRATVKRIIDLDQVYPGLERHALIRNYRCGKRITKASRKLIRHNKIRFDKPLHSGARIKGIIICESFESRAEGAAVVAELLAGEDGDEMVVLARTSRLLDEVRQAYKKRNGRDPGIELATVHASKGREWDRVILFGVDEGQNPHGQSSKSEEGIEDERRLFYVAMTRAKMRLEIISTKGKESRFLKEAGM
ncbi:MAG: ATP-dependent helicase [bacterium]|nr:ATP-dependent helicase [bacterium]